MFEQTFYTKHLPTITCHETCANLRDHNLDDNFQQMLCINKLGMTRLLHHENTPNKHRKTRVVIRRHDANPASKIS